MPLSVKIQSFVRNLFLSNRINTDIDLELNSHLEMLTEEKMRSGMPAAEARRAARIELGGLQQMKEQLRERRSGNWVHSVVSDCRYGLRQLRKKPGFTAVAIFALALGIGLNAAVFTAYKAIIGRPVQARNPGEMVNLALGRSSGSPDFTFSYPDYEAYRD